jgi:hypothetical protein
VTVAGVAGPVKDVLIRDNGVGFNQANFDSFRTPDSVYKLKRGGKGLGRLICLQVFERVEVKSTYRDGGDWEKREFVFQADHPEIVQSTTPAKANNPNTEVRLIGLRNDYNCTATVEFKTIAQWLAEHFLPALVEKPQWLQKLVVRDGTQEQDLTKLIQGCAVWSESFTINQYDFYSACYAVIQTEKPDQVRLVASGRVVDANTRELEHYLPHLGSISDDIGHIVLVHSAFFDEHVNEARNGVSFGDDGEEGALLGITAAQFREGLAGALRKHLSDRLDHCDEELKKRIESVVREEAPFYKPLLRGFFESKEFSVLSKSVRDEEILTSLDQYKRRETINLKKESKRLARLH